MNAEQQLPPKVAFDCAVVLLKKELVHVPAEALSGMFTSLLARVAEEISETFWSEAMKTAKTPCGKPECDCERVRSQVMEAVDSVRERWKQKKDEERGEKGFAE